MAIKVEELQVLISANADQFRNEFAKISNQLGNLQTQTKQTGLAMKQNLVGGVIAGNVVSTVLMGTLRKLGTTFTNLTRVVVQQGSEYSRLKVATDTVTANLGITADEVNKLRDSLAESNTYGIQAENVIKTLALSGLWELSKSLEYVDARTGKTVTGMQALVLEMKDLSASAGIDSATGIERLTRFIRRGEATYADGIIEVGNLNTAYRAFAKSRNKNLQDLTQEEYAEARLNIVRLESIKAFSAYANSMQTSGKAMDSVKNATINTAQILGNMFEPALSALSNGLFQFINGVRGAILGSENDIRGFANRVAGYVVALIRIVGTYLSALPMVGKFFNSLATFTMKPIKAVGGLDDKTKDLAKSMQGASKSTKDLKKELAGLAGFDEMQVLNPPKEATAGGVSGGGSGITPILDSVKTNIPDFSKEINEQADKVIKKINEMIQPLKDFGEWVEKNRGYLVVLGATLGALVVGFLIASGAISVTTITAGIASGVFSVLLGVVGTLGSVIGFLVSPIGLVILAIGAMVLALVWLWNNSDKVNNALKAGWEKVKGWANDLWLWLKDTFTKIGNWVKGVWDGVVNGAVNIKSGITNAFNTVLATATSIFNKIKTVITDAFKGAVNGAIGSMNTLLTMFGRLVNYALIPFNAMIDGFNKIPNVRLNRISVNMPQIPKLATGGIATSPTMAMIGEAGREAVLPLDNNNGWIDELAGKINNLGGGGNTQLIVKLGEETIYNRFIDWHNDRSKLGGLTLLNV